MRSNEAYEMRLCIYRPNIIAAVKLFNPPILCSLPSLHHVPPLTNIFVPPYFKKCRNDINSEQVLISNQCREYESRTSVRLRSRQCAPFLVTEMSYVHTDNS